METTGKLKAKMKCITHSEELNLAQDFDRKVALPPASHVLLAQMPEWRNRLEGGRGKSTAAAKQRQAPQRG